MEPRRSQILGTALDLLAESGTKGLSHRAIDRQLGIPLGSTANYYSTRRALVDAVLAHVMELQRSTYVELGAERHVRTADEAAGVLTEFVRAAAVGPLAAQSLAVLSLTVGGEAQALRVYHEAAVEQLAVVLAEIGLSEPQARAIPLTDYMNGVIIRAATGQGDFDETEVHGALRRLLGP